MSRTIGAMTLCFVIFVAVASAETDVAKFLVGTWEGEAHPIGREARGFNFQRVLIIESVKGGPGRWAVAGRFGIPGQNLAKVRPKLRVNGSDVSLVLELRNGDLYTLALQNEKYLVGKWRIVGTANERTITFERSK